MRGSWPSAHTTGAGANTYLSCNLCSNNLFVLESTRGS
jgi:hypothetical protein